MEKINIIKKAAENLKKKRWGWGWRLKVGRMKMMRCDLARALYCLMMYFFFVKLKYTLKVIPKYFWQPQTIFHRILARNCRILNKNEKKPRKILLESSLFFLCLAKKRKLEMSNTLHVFHIIYISVFYIFLSCFIKYSICV